jgi:hypothetical protein
MSIVSRKFESSRLNEEDCFMLWFNLHTLDKVSRHLASKQIINRTTGKMYTRQAVYMAAMRWVFKNPDAAFEYYIKAGADISRLKWEEWLVKSAIIQLAGQGSIKKFSRWIQENGFERYNYIYEPILGKSNYPEKV